MCTLCKLVYRNLILSSRWITVMTTSPWVCTTIITCQVTMTSKTEHEPITDQYWSYKPNWNFLLLIPTQLTCNLKNVNADTDAFLISSAKAHLKETKSVLLSCTVLMG